jgi:hypothetical protein
LFFFSVKHDNSLFHQDQAHCLMIIKVVIGASVQIPHCSNQCAKTIVWILTNKGMTLRIGRIVGLTYLNYNGKVIC